MRGSRAADPAAGRLGIFATSPRRTAHGPEARARARSGRLATRRVRRTTSRFRYAILGVRGALLSILRGFRRAALPQKKGTCAQVCTGAVHLRT